MRRTVEKGSLASKNVVYKDTNSFNVIERHSALYSPRGLEYQQAHSGPFEDLSYFGGDAVIIAALKNGQISGYGRPVVAAGQSKALKTEIQRLYEITPNIFYQDFLYKGNLSVISKFFIGKGAQVTTYHTQIINLNQSERRLHEGIRKSYTSLTNSRLSACHIIDGKSPRLDLVFGLFKELYHINVENPRPEETWDIQLEMIRNNEAFICADLEGERLLSAGLFLHNKYFCYYGVGKSLPKCGSHSTIWKAILHAKSIGLQSFELGEQVYYGDPKLVGISRFKAGFGGQTRTYLQIRSY